MQILKQIQTAVSDQLPGNTALSSKNPIQTNLYACENCGITYIASEMESCPECQGALDEVPSGAELGFTSVEQ
jgi:rubrerythrin